MASFVRFLLILVLVALSFHSSAAQCATIGHRCSSRTPCCNNHLCQASICVRDPCKGLRARRKEILDMTRAEWTRYTDALRTLNDNGVYARYVQYHRIYAAQAHGGCFFLPWHRQYLFEFERELNRVSPGISIPYWDWTKTSPTTGEAIFNAFTNDPIWNRAGGGNGVQGPAPIPNAPFMNWFTDGRTCQRDFVQNNGNRGGGGFRWTFASSQQIASLVAGRDSYASFANVLELMHGTVHNAVGGTMSIITTSPTDPIFFSHHAYVDKIWRDWQLAGNGNSFGGTQPNPTRACSLDGETMTPPNFGRTVRQILNDISSCTTYGRDPNAGPTSRFLVSDNDFTTIHQSISSPTSALGISSAAENRTYQAQINNKKRERPAVYRTEVQNALNCIDSITRANRFIGLPENYIQTGLTLFRRLLYKLGVDVERDRNVVSQSNAAIAQSASSDAPASSNSSSLSG